MKLPGAKIRIAGTSALVILSIAAMVGLYIHFATDINRVLSNTDKGALLELLGLSLFVLLARAVAWEWVYRSGGGKSSQSELHFSSSMTYIANLILPPYLGNLVRPLALRWLTSNKGTTGQLVFNDASVLTVEALLHIPLLIFLIININVNKFFVALGIGAIMFLSLGFWFLRHKYADKSWSKGFAIFEHPKDFAALSALSAFILILQIIKTYFAIDAVGLDASWSSAVAVFVLTSAFAIIPAGPAPSTIGAVLVVFNGQLASAAAAGLLITLAGAAAAIIYAVFALILGLPKIIKRNKRVEAALEAQPEKV